MPKSKLDMQFAVLDHIIKVLDAAENIEQRDTYIEKIKTDVLMGNTNCTAEVADSWIKNALDRSKWAEATA